LPSELQNVINQNPVFMNKSIMRTLALFFILLFPSCNAPGGNSNTVVLMKTTLGDIKLLLYDDTPLHRDNFIKLVNSGFYEGISFHRVIKEFMIQAGDPATRSIPVDTSADSLFTYTIPSEFLKNHFHKKGALAAAREGNDVNPEMRSSGTHFYIVQGKKLTDAELDEADQRVNSNVRQALFNKYIRYYADSAAHSGVPMTEGEIQEKASEKMFDYLTTEGFYKIPEDQREVYRTVGGVPRLDGTYTVFGEVISGLDVVDKIAEVETDATDKPLSEIKILKIKIVK
jgi:cyclophilin family peptidyl-prolyl cis-trans isomerase